MKAIKIILYINILFLGAISCSKLSVEDNKFSLVSENDTLHYVQIKTDTTINNWQLPYPVYQFQVGDVDNNGKDDILVGVIKTTRFDSTMSKRLFIFKNYYGLVRPLWLGSSLGQELVDFKFVEDKKGARIRSIEKEKSGKYLVAEYKWRKFGLKFTTYINREITIEKAKALLNE
ncbi:hypothetical protein [Flavivirga jejuensis]|uniref:Lipoprotein n=1 Tax=Flavivirga jejuensis TaxID=870487 RepID=A0ABT8WUV4_9FLAO|nr:hypothetical protein [Flavivirga jejuensis]MDO5976963.1 hypothetical protein [Flavivirga jejuensis]